MMDRDNITRTGARAPGVKRPRSLERWCTSAPRSSTLSEDTALQAAGCTKDGGKPPDAKHRSRREGPSDIPAFQPDWGKLTVRNDRGDHGNGGIIRSPIRAMVLPDQVGPTSSRRRWWKSIRVILDGVGGEPRHRRGVSGIPGATSVADAQQAVAVDPVTYYRIVHPTSRKAKGNPQSVGAT